MRILPPGVGGHEGPVGEARSGRVVRPGVEEGGAGAAGRDEEHPQVAPLHPACQVDRAYHMLQVPAPELFGCVGGCGFALQ